MSAAVDPAALALPDELLGPRLRLRPHRAGDGPVLLDALQESAASLRTFLWGLGWVAQDHTLASAEARALHCAAQWAARSDLAWLMFRRDDDRLVGSVGLHRTDWTVPCTEVGYWVRPSEAGRGWASEGVRTVVDWAFEGLGAVRVALVSDAENLASRWVAERCGFMLEGVHRQVLRDPQGRLRDHCVYARLAPDRR